MDPIVIDLNAILGVGFVAWAGVIGWLGQGIFKRLDQTSEALQEYIVQTETRLAVLETKLAVLET